MHPLQAEKKLVRARSKDEIRDLLMGQHAILRVMLAGLATSCDRCLREGALPSGLKVRIAELRPAFELHLRSEESCLEPILAGHSWGPVRLTLLQAEHAHQRAVFKALARSEARLEPLGLARLAAALVEDLLADMDGEECELFAAVGLQRRPGP